MRAAALLAAVVCLAAIGACGDDDGAEPGASQEATLVLDFIPNAVHTGVYVAQERGFYAEEGVELEVVEPSASTDAPKLLESGRAEFAILDIHDLAIAREAGFDLVGVAAIVQRPLAAVIARDREAVRTPADLEGGQVGVTGLPSDDAVLDSVLEAGGADPGEVEPITIGFEAVKSLAAGRLDAATAFWNAEGVALKRQGVPTREFRVDDFGAPQYPELVLVTGWQKLDGDPELVEAVVAAVTRGYEEVVADPESALGDLVAGNEGLDVEEQGAQLQSLLAADAFTPAGALDPSALELWAQWDAEHGIVETPPDVDAAFEP